MFIVFLKLGWFEGGNCLGGGGGGGNRLPVAVEFPQVLASNFLLCMKHSSITVPHSQG